jgi:hypothetical protein
MLTSPVPRLARTGGVDLGHDRYLAELLRWDHTFLAASRNDFNALELASQP